jgi:hypothetical protein
VYQNVLDLSFLDNGVYVIRVVDSANSTSMSQKLLITR